MTLRGYPVVAYGMGTSEVDVLWSFDFPFGLEAAMTIAEINYLITRVFADRLPQLSMGAISPNSDSRLLVDLAL